MDDHELLREYVDHRSEPAFRELVTRHLGMVYSAACRMVRDSHLAEEVAQNVFATLAQKAGTLGPAQVVGGWLYHTTRHLALHAIRTEQRRREREQTAAAMQALETNPDPQQIAEQLEPAMEQLEADERDMLVLRYLENRSLREVGSELRISEDAARMRVNRALEQLRSRFAQQGIHLTTALLASALLATTATAVPGGLSAIIVTAAVAGTVTAVTTTHVVLTTMNWINTKTIAALCGAAIIAGTGTYLVQQREIKTLRASNETLVAQQEQLTKANETATTAAQAQADELERLRQDKTELLRLRNEVGQLRKQREAEKLLAQQPPATSPTPPAKETSSNYFHKDRVAYVGYATPEAALQSITWATLNGTPEQMAEGLSPQLINNAEAYQNFEVGRKQGAPMMTGIQIMAKKTLSETEVEMKLRVDTTPIPGQPAGDIPTTILPLVKVGNEWKVGIATRDFDPSWDQNGKIQILAQ